MDENTFQLDATSSENGLEITYTTSNTDNNISLSTSGLITITDLDLLGENGTNINVTATDEYGYSSSKNINIKLLLLENTQWIYNLPGTYQWTCPDSITNISVVAVGGGGGSGGGDTGTYSTKGTGGGGGGLIWVNNISVIPGNNYIIEVGGSGLGSLVDINGSDATSGDDTKFIHNGNELFIAHGGGGGETTVYAQGGGDGGIGGGRTINISGHTDYGGGNGGNGGSQYNTTFQCGGGGAGGYTGKGGDGAGSKTDINSHYRQAEDGQGGGGGGGGETAWSYQTSESLPNAGYGAGGGVGIFGQGDNGIGGMGKYPRTGPMNGEDELTEFTNARGQNLITRLTVSSGTPGSNGESVKIVGNMFTAGSYGGGAGGFKAIHGSISNGGLSRSNGANGALRIIYNPEASFPSTNVSSSYYHLTYTNENGI